MIQHPQVIYTIQGSFKHHLQYHTSNFGLHYPCLHYKFIRFIINDQNEHLLLYIKDHLNQVEYVNDQNEHLCYILRPISIK